MRAVAGHRPHADALHAAGALRRREAARGRRSPSCAPGASPSPACASSASSRPSRPPGRRRVPREGRVPLARRRRQPGAQGAAHERRRASSPARSPNLGSGSPTAPPGPGGTAVYVVPGPQRRARSAAQTSRSSCTSTARPPTSAISTRSRPGQTREVRFTGPVCQRGLRVVVDPSDAVKERFESDNTATVGCPPLRALTRLRRAPSADSIHAMSDADPARPAKDAPIGGQAVLEGVMMRGVSTWAVAVRKPSAEQLEEHHGEEPRPDRGRARRDRDHLRAARLVDQAPPLPTACRSSAASSRWASR